MRESRLARVMWGAALTLVYAFVFGPLVLVALVSFSADSYLSFPPSGWSLRWYRALIESTKFTSAAGVSLAIALAVSTASLALGIPAALALARGSFPGRTAIATLMLSPLILPTIVIGLAILLVFSQVKLSATYPGLVLAHLVITLPFTIRILTTTLTTLPLDVESAAATLGASRWQVLRLVTLPLMLPGIVASTALSFILSFDEVVLSLFVVGPRLSTLPVEIYRYVHERTDPFVAAVSVVMIVLTVAVVLIVERTVGFMKTMAK